MDFIRVCTKESRKKGGPTEVYADLVVGPSRDLMTQGGAFYAVWDEEQGLWSREALDVQRLVDRKIREKVEELEAEGIPCEAKYLSSYGTNSWNQFVKFTKNVPDNSKPLDTKVTFSGGEVKRTKKSDYASRRLDYPLAPGDISAYEELVTTLYTPEERYKFEWAIGSIISGDSKRIEKFLVFFGGPGTGKSTILKIISKLFGGKVSDGGYVAFFDAQALTGNSNAFATSAFKDNPLVAIQHDGDLSKIETNARLNSIVSHEDMEINEKYKTQYTKKINAMLFMGTNKPVQITDAKSGLIRRLIDVNPTGYTHEVGRYNILMDRIDFELGAIAYHCLQVYKESKGRNAFEDYKPESMMLKTDVFYNFIEDHFDIFKAQDYTTFKQAWELYKIYCDEGELPFKLTQIKFREALKDYFDSYEDRSVIDGVATRKVYRGFAGTKFKEPVSHPDTDEKVFSLVLGETESILDEMYSGVPAQYANADGNPRLYWDFSERLNKKGDTFVPKESQVVSTVLGDLNTSELHFVKVPEHHIVIDFDLKDDDGNKSLELNLQAASSWPPTYAEVSKSGQGIHLHYLYDGDTSELSNQFAEGIEVKTFHGNASLRRRLTRCNNVAVATISSGIRKKPTVQTSTLKTEQGLRRAITRNLNREIHPGTKPSIDFIEHLLKEAYNTGVIYDVSDMRQLIMAFANNSTNQAPACLKAVTRMRFKSELTHEDVAGQTPAQADREDEERPVFFDTEVYPNLFVLCWKYQGSDTVVRMIDPSPVEIENFLKIYKIIGYNNRKYDNHILWARQLGADNEQLYRLSQRLIANDETAYFGGAWSASYADVFDFASVKQSLKKWEIDLGIDHIEMDIPWDQPVPPEKVTQVVDYCCNDVKALEAVFNACKADFQARRLLADLSGLTVNHSTRQHVMRILFGNERNPQDKFVYTDLSEMFPGYEFDKFSKTDKSTYKGEVVGEGGYVYAEPGMYENVAVLDIASMHPTSIIELNLFGPYTEKFQRILEARLAIKHANEAWSNGDETSAQSFISQVNSLVPGIEVDKENASALANALKLVLNSTYGYTCAKFDNPARDPRNIDNIVAKRGALFMVDLKNAVQEAGYTVAHIKTDSIKIPNATTDIIEFVKEFGSRYGYTFEHEATYKKMCLVNDAVLIAYVGWNAKGKPEHWKAVGAEFQHPFVFKTLFTDEPITFRDLCETKQVKKGAMYLKFNGVEKQIGEPKEASLGFDVDLESLPDSAAVDIFDDKSIHIGRSGLFVPINPDQEMFQGGELICRRDDLGKDYAVPGTKGFLWAEAEMIRALQAGAIDRLEFEHPSDAVEGTGTIADVVDMKYFTGLAESAAQSIEEFGDFEGFVS